MKELISIIVADDHQLVRSGIVKILNENPEMEVIAEASNGKEALEKCAIFSPDILLLDLDMPILNGLEAVPELMTQNPGMKIGILTMHKEKSLVEKLINLGVAGYLYKSSHEEDLIYGIKKIADGKTFYASEVTESLVGKSRRFTSTDPSHMVMLAELSEREKEILILIAEGFSNKEIGEKLFISVRTVDTHRSNIMKKVGIKNMAGLVRFAISSGLI